MKKLFSIFLIITLVFSFNLHNVSFASANCANISVPKTEDLLNNFIKILDSYKNQIGVIAKNVIEVKGKNDTDKINDYLQDINYLKSQVSGTIKDLEAEYKLNSNDEKATAKLLSIGIILVQYRFALTQLSYFLKAENIDDKFTQLDLFFGFYNDSNQKLNCLKNNCIAW